MARRNYYLLPASTVLMDPPEGYAANATNVWPGGDPYGGSPQTTLHEAWRDTGKDDITEGGDEPCEADKGSFGWFWPLRLAGGNAHLIVALEQPPTLVDFLKLTFHVWWDYTQSGPNNWYFPPDNAQGPRMRFALRNRAKDGYLYGPYEVINDDAPTDFELRNCRIVQTACGTGYGAPRHSTWELTSHPEGGIISLDDMVALAAGVNVDVAAPAYLETQGSFFKVRFFHFYVEVLAQDTGGDVEGPRWIASQQLRLARVGTRALLTTLPMPDATLTLGERAYFSWEEGAHPDGRGWGTAPLSRRAALPLYQTVSPETMEVSYKMADLREILCRAWASYRIDVPWTPNLNGMAYLDQGGGFSETRAQDAWSPRHGDGTLMRVPENLLPLDYEGTPICQGGDTELSLRNFNPGAASWSATGVANLTLQADTAAVMADELGYAESLRFTFGTSGQGGRTQALGTIPATGGHRISVLARVRNISVATPATQFMEYVLWREKLVATVPVTEYLDFATRTWGTSPVYNAIPSDEPYGEILADGIDCDTTADAAPAYHHKIGRFSSAISSAAFTASLTSVQLDGLSYGVRPPLVSLDATVVRVASLHRVENAELGRIWFGQRGTFIAELRPFWRAALLTEDKPIWYARHSATTYDRVDFLASRDLRFRRHVGGVDYDATVAVATALTRAHVLRVWCRWLDVSGWEEYAPYRLSVGFTVIDRATGVRLETSAAHAPGPTSIPSLDPDAYCWPGYAGGTARLDGWLRWWETTLTPLHETECLWRR